MTRSSRTHLNGAQRSTSLRGRMRSSLSKLLVVAATLSLAMVSQNHEQDSFPSNHVAGLVFRQMCFPSNRKTDDKWTPISLPDAKWKSTYPILHPLHGVTRDIFEKAVTEFREKNIPNENWFSKNVTEADVINWLSRSELYRIPTCYN